MSGSASDGYIGKIVSLISTASIRYEGTIQAIDNDKITLKNGIFLDWKVKGSPYLRNRRSQM